MMMGTADEIVKAPEKGPVFVEDLPEEEQVVAVVSFLNFCVNLYKSQVHLFPHSCYLTGITMYHMVQLIRLLHGRFMFVHFDNFLACLYIWLQFIYCFKYLGNVALLGTC